MNIRQLIIRPLVSLACGIVAQKSHADGLDPNASSKVFAKTGKNLSPVQRGMDFFNQKVLAPIKVLKVNADQALNRLKTVEPGSIPASIQEDATTILSGKNKDLSTEEISAQYQRKLEEFKNKLEEESTAAQAKRDEEWNKMLDQMSGKKSTSPETGSGNTVVAANSLNQPELPETANQELLAEKTQEVAVEKGGTLVTALRNLATRDMERLRLAKEQVAEAVDSYECFCKQNPLKWESSEGKELQDTVNKMMRKLTGMLLETRTTLSRKEIREESEIVGFKEEVDVLQSSLDTWKESVAFIGMREEANELFKTLEENNNSLLDETKKWEVYRKIEAGECKEPYSNLIDKIEIDRSRMPDMSFEALVAFVDEIEGNAKNSLYNYMLSGNLTSDVIKHVNAYVTLKNRTAPVSIEDAIKLLLEGNGQSCDFKKEMTSQTEKVEKLLGAINNSIDVVGRKAWVESKKIKGRNAALAQTLRNMESIGLRVQNHKNEMADRKLFAEIGSMKESLNEALGMLAHPGALTDVEYGALKTRVFLGKEDLTRKTGEARRVLGRASKAFENSRTAAVGESDEASSNATGLLHEFSRQESNGETVYGTRTWFGLISDAAKKAAPYVEKTVKVAAAAGIAVAIVAVGGEGFDKVGNAIAGALNG